MGMEFSPDDLQPRVLDFLLADMSKLWIQNKMLKQKLDESLRIPQKRADEVVQEQKESDSPAEGHGIRSLSEFPTFHLVLCRGRAAGATISPYLPDRQNFYYDVPRTFKGDMRSDHLRGRSGIDNISKYMEKHPELVAAPVHRYQCFCKGGKDYRQLVGYANDRLIKDAPPAESDGKMILLGESVRSGLLAILDARNEDFIGFSKEAFSLRMDEPFYPFYVHNKTFMDHVDTIGLNDTICQQVKTLCRWFTEHCKDRWQEADALFAKGKVTYDHINMLYLPDELLVSGDDNQSENPSVIRTGKYPWQQPWRDVFYLQPPGASRDFIETWEWEFNGKFYKSEGRMASSNFIRDRDGEKDITSLEWYPLRYAPPRIREQLVVRGRTFWNCRKTRLVTYNKAETGNKMKNLKQVGVTSSLP